MTDNETKARDHSWDDDERNPDRKYAGTAKSKGGDGPPMDRIATVTIQRTEVGKGLVDVTVCFKLREVQLGYTTTEQWVLSAAIDEDGDPVSLSKTERLLAYCMVNNGVDETGR